jgi:hypothetical protein
MVRTGHPRPRVRGCQWVIVLGVRIEVRGINRRQRDLTYSRSDNHRAPKGTQRSGAVTGSGRMEAEECS